MCREKYSKEITFHFHLLLKNLYTLSPCFLRFTHQLFIKHLLCADSRYFSNQKRKYKKLKEDSFRMVEGKSLLFHWVNLPLNTCFQFPSVNWTD